MYILLLLFRVKQIKSSNNSNFFCIQHGKTTYTNEIHFDVFRMKFLLKQKIQ